jgi:N-glycosylase/DNA lyase
LIKQINDDFDLERIAQSGQCFRWHPQADGSYRIMRGEACVYVEQLDSTHFRFDCDEVAFKEVWRDYFDLNESYSAIRARVDEESDPFLWRASECEKGIRILRQDPWETLISFIISQNRNIPAICRSIELLAEAAGEEAEDRRGRMYRCFPSAEAVASLTQDVLLRCKLGYRWKYVKSAAEAILEGLVDLEALKNVTDEEAMASLVQLPGVGPKVASCVALFGLRQLDAFPVDTWMKKVLSNEYPQGYPFEKYSPYNGIFQQYLFAYYRNRLSALK